MKRQLWWVLASGWRLTWILPAVVVLAAAQALLPDLFTAPALRASLPVSAPTALVAGTLTALIAVLSVDEPSPHIRRLSSPRRRLLGPLRVATLLVLANLIVALAAPQQAPATAVVTLTTAGEALIVWALLGRFTWVIPAVHAAASLLLGATTFGGTAWWAWPANPETSVAAGEVATALIITGLGTSTYRSVSKRKDL